MDTKKWPWISHYYNTQHKFQYQPTIFQRKVWEISLFQSLALLAQCYKPDLKCRSRSEPEVLTSHGWTADFLNATFIYKMKESQLHLPVSGLEYSRHRISESWASTFSISLRDCNSYILGQNMADFSMFNNMSKNWFWFSCLPSLKSAQEAPRDYLRVPILSPEARCSPLGLTQTVRIPTFASITGASALSALPPEL